VQTKEIYKLRLTTTEFTNDVRLEGLSGVAMKSAVSWDVAPYNLQKRTTSIFRVLE
jgi:hypothetical protein